MKIVKTIIAISLASSFSVIANDLNSEITSLMENKEWIKALEKIESGLISDKQDARLLFRKGVVLSQLKRKDEAISVFKLITETHPKIPEPYNNLAVFYAEDRQYDMALKMLQTATNINPQYSIAWNNLGDVYLRLAEAAFKKSSNNDPDVKDKLAQIADIFEKKPIVSLPFTQPKPQPEKIATDSSAQENKKESTQVSENETIKKVIDSWAKAWSLRDVKAYLWFYSPEFQIPSNMTREQWEALRYKRIRSRHQIDVKIEDLRVEVVDGIAKLNFTQIYKADHINQRNNKTIKMKRYENQWKIISED